MDKKICPGCKTKKEFSNFYNSCRTKDGKSSYCKACQLIYSQKNKDRVNGYKKKYLAKMEEVERPIKLALFLAKEATKKENKQLQRERAKIRAKRPDVIEKKKLCDKKYRESHKAERQVKEKHRRDNDLNYRLNVNLRIRMKKALFNNQKAGGAVKDLGCSVDFLKKYLEAQFKSGMSWKNYGHGPTKWQIDHIQPLCSFDLTNREHFLIAAHYTNLQPLWFDEHAKKSVQDKLKSINRIQYAKLG